MSLTQVTVSWSEEEYHDTVMTMSHFPHYCPFVLGIYRPPVNSTQKVQKCSTSMAYLCHFLSYWISLYSNNRVAGDVKRRKAHVTSLLRLHTIELILANYKNWLYKQWCKPVRYSDTSHILRHFISWLGFHWYSYTTSGNIVSIGPSCVFPLSLIY